MQIIDIVKSFICRWEQTGKGELDQIKIRGDEFYRVGAGRNNGSRAVLSMDFGEEIEVGRVGL